VNVPSTGSDSRAVRYLRPLASSRSLDALARPVAIAIAATRIGIGVGAFARTRPALRLAGFERPDASSVVLARLAGARDIALGVLLIAVRDDPARLSGAAALATAVDAADAIAFGAALAGRDGIDRTALRNLPVAGAAVVAGSWITAQLRAQST